ncbi:hypothetical protein O9Z70_05285 [Devosia sp. YIM 151766]|uniref:hypothetical protein n=1 Tax=Devosia sp. YIM 151766 TaxID=3017325 RepID=UPI00255C5ADF|nr:hypothetical protein [Devosia sp. YIM 151766]WIY53946.1 hypothetical protein O9Z70_05285 [Devosia sp. YIM 151766]
MSVQRIVISSLLALLVLAFLGVFGLAALRELPESNSYALLAEGWLQGRFHTEHCFDDDCALYNGLIYIIFPPMPGIISLPFVALFGVGFNFFIPLTIMAFAITGWMWWGIFIRETNSRDLTILLLLMVLFATPLAFVTLRGDHVWFFAQTWGFLFSTGALYFALVRRNALLVGLFIGMAFLSRQMTILYLPFLYVLLLPPETPLFRIDMAAFKRALALAALPIFALAIYFAYNYVRFGSPMETGYSYIFPVEFDEGPGAGSFLSNRVRELGIFSDQYFLFNLVYMFIAGPHVEFAGRYMTELVGFDINGASLFLVTPVLLLALLAPWNRSFWFGLGTAGLILVLTLFYHSNGFSQYSAQRYTLDWLPILFVFLARSVKPAYGPPLSIFTAYSMAITLSMIALGGFLAA